MKFTRRTLYTGIGDILLPGEEGHTLRQAIVLMTRQDGHDLDDVEKVLVPVWFYDTWVAAVGSFPNNEPIMLGLRLEKHAEDEIKVVFKEKE